MRAIFTAALLATAALVCHADFDPTNVYIVGKTNKSALSYKPGEEMVYTFKAELGNQKADGLFLRWDRKGDDGQKASGKVPANQGGRCQDKARQTRFCQRQCLSGRSEGKNRSAGVQGLGEENPEKKHRLLRRNRCRTGKR